MKLFRKLFAEKILRYYEGTEAGIKIIKKLPILKKLVKEESFGEKSKSRAFIGALAQAFMLAWEFIRKFLYVVLLIYGPYIILAHFFPLIRIHQDISIIYLFIMLSTICGSLANTTILAMGDRDFVALFLSLAPAFSPQVFHNVTVKPAVHNDVVMNTNGGFAVSLRGVGGNDHVL